MSVQSGHTSDITTLAITSDGRFLVTGSADRSVIVWDSLGRQIRRFGGHRDGITALALGPNNEVFSAAEDVSLLKWDLRSGDTTASGWNLTGKRDYSLERQRHYRSLAIDPTQRYLVAAEAAEIELFDRATLRPLGYLRNPSLFGIAAWRSTAIGFLPDGRLIVADSASDISIWHLHPDHRRERKFESGKRNVSAIAVDPAGRYFATASDDGTITLWSPDNNQPMRAFSHGAKLLAIAVSPDGKTIASSGADGTIKLWDASTGSSRSLRTPRGAVANVLAFHPSGGALVGAMGAVVLRWELADSVPSIAAIRNTDFPQDIAAGGDRLFVASTSIFSWEPGTGRMEVLSQHRSLVRRLAASTDGSRLVSADDSTLMYWNLSARRVRELNVLAATALAIDDSGRVAVARADRWIGVWRVAPGSGAPGLDSMIWFREREDVSGLAFSPSGRMLVSRTDSGVTIWNLDHCSRRDANSAAYSCSADRPRINEGPDRLRYISAALVSPNGHYLLAGSMVSDTAVRLWDIEGHEQLIKYTGHRNGAASLAFHPSGDSFFTAGYDESVREWSLTDGKHSREFAGTDNGVRKVVVAPDGKTLYGLSNDGGVIAWDTRTKSILATIITNTQMGRAPEWTVVAPDGRFDTNSFEMVRSLYWVADDDPMVPLPLENFMRQFYETRLLPKRFAHTPLANVPEVSRVNRALPVVRVTRVDTVSNDTSMVRVTVAIAETKRPTHTGLGDTVAGSGAYDLRLFRDGQLVGQYPADTSTVPATTLAQWRRLHAIATPTHEFLVRRPRRAPTDTVVFTAYAFNSDRVKGETVADTILETNAVLRPRRAYLVAVGVGQNDEPSFNLGSAPFDAHAILDSLTTALDSGHYQIEKIPIISSPPPVALSRRTRPISPEAVIAPTRENIWAVLNILAGGRPAATQTRNIPPSLLQRLQRANPGDLVIISITAHGLIDSTRKEFVLLPADATAAGTGSNPFPRAISSTELSAWIRDMDAGSLVLVLSTCYSSRAVDSPAFRPGPMGESGFGQLAYDKGMQILVAAENEAEGLGELTRLGQALVIDGPKSLRGRQVALTDLLRLAERTGAAGGQIPQLFDFRRGGKDVPLYAKQ